MLVLRRLTSVADATMAVIRDVLTDFGLTMSSAALLWALDPQGEPPTMRSLARTLGCDPSTVSLMADKLDAAGLLERRPHPTDGRMRILAPTDQGRTVWNALGSTLSRTSGLTALSSAELRTLDGLLARVQSAGERERPHNRGSGPSVVRT